MVNGVNAWLLSYTDALCNMIVTQRPKELNKEGRRVAVAGNISIIARCLTQMNMFGDFSHYQT